MYVNTEESPEQINKLKIYEIVANEYIWYTV